MKTGRRITRDFIKLNTSIHNVWLNKVYHQFLMYRCSITQHLAFLSRLYLAEKLIKALFLGA